MTSLLHRFDSPGMRLIVALPANDPIMARAAAESGADAVKTHLRVRHAASGRTFGTLNEERGNLEEILATCKIPVGMVPGADIVDRLEVEELVTLGFDFIDIYLRHMPAWLLSLQGASLMAALHPGCATELAHSAAQLPLDMFEVSVIPPDGYGKVLTAGDLALYRSLVAALGDKPAILPTERYVTPDDLPYVQAVGIRSIMIGAVYTGSDASSVARGTTSFRKALDALG